MESKSVVWMVSIEDSRNVEEVKRKLNLLLEKSDFHQRMSLKEREIIAIKLHFGEKGTDGYIKPPIVKVFVDDIKQRKARPFLAETSVVYKSVRGDAIGHLELAFEHGFEYSQVGAPVVILDGLSGENWTKIQIDKKHFQTVSTAGGIQAVQGLISIAHFTGHYILSFAATLKNIAMGLASRAGKLQQHFDIRPFVLNEKCTFCQKCLGVCPVQAIKEQNKKAFIDQKVCIGCAECILTCPVQAIAFPRERNVEAFQEKVAEYAFGILKNFKKTYFFNFAYYITKDCDCESKQEPPVVGDIGILASANPLALDKATNDLVIERAGRDILKELHPNTGWKRNLEYAHEIGVGRLDYIIKTIKE